MFWLRDVTVMVAETHAQHSSYGINHLIIESNKKNQCGCLVARINDAPIEITLKAM